MKPPQQAELPTDPSLTTGQYLREQSANAAAAFKHTLGALSSALSQSVNQKVNPARLTREHPLIALPTALIAGFAAASAVVPSKQQQAEARLARLVAALTPPSPPTTPVADSSDKTADSRGWLQKLAGTVGSELIHALKPSLTELLFGSLAGASAVAAETAETGASAQPQNPVDDAKAPDPSDIADISSPS
jgi:hypothetical protein